MKSRAIKAWNKCHPCQHTTVGKLDIVKTPSLFWHCTTLNIVSVMGRKSTVTNSGTIFARITKGKVNLNFFFEKE